MKFLFENTEDKWHYTPDGATRKGPVALADAFIAILKDSGRLDLIPHAPALVRHFENSPSQKFHTSLSEIIKISETAKTGTPAKDQPRRNSLMGNWKPL